MTRSRPLAFILAILMAVTIWTPLNAPAFATPVDTASLDHFDVEVDSKVAVNNYFNITVTAIDTEGNLKTDYNGSVILGSSNNSVFTLPIGGQSLVNGTLTISTVVASATGIYWIDAIDTTTGTFRGVTSDFNVIGPVYALTLNPADTTTKAGIRTPYVVGREDYEGNAVPFDSLKIYLESNSQNGTFYDSATGGSTISYIDIADGATTADFWYYSQTAGSDVITASTYEFTVSNGSPAEITTTASITINPAAFAGFRVEGIEDPQTYGDQSGVTVTAIDIYGNTITDYTGTVVFNTNDTTTSAIRTMPDDYLFQAGDYGVHHFASTSIRFSNVGTYWFRAADKADGSKYGIQEGIYVGPYALSLSGSFTASNKIYDGDDDAVINTSGLSLSARLFSDSVHYDATGSFDSKNVGTSREVSLSASLDGTDHDNYSLNSYSEIHAHANITPKGLAGSFIVPASKIYDGTTATSITTTTLSGIVSGEEALVTLSALSATYDTKNVGTDKTVTLNSPALSGTETNIGNYYLTPSSIHTHANITQKELTGSFTAPATKIYDATTATSISTTTLSGIVVGEEALVTLSAVSATYDTKNVGTSKMVTLNSPSLSGDAGDIGNYYLATSPAIHTHANITKKSVTIAGIFTAEDKVYDGTTVASILYTYIYPTSISSTELPLNGLYVDGLYLDGLISGDEDTVTLSAIGAFADEDVATGIEVSIVDGSLGGTDGGNYSIASYGTYTTTAAITVKPVTGSFTVPASKIYDGTNAASVLTTTVNGKITGDAVTLNGVNATYATSAIGTGILVTLNTPALEGADSTNYSLTTAAITTTADIRAASSGGGGGGGGLTVTPEPTVLPNTLRFNIGNTNSFQASGSAIEVLLPMDVAPIIYEDRTLLPIRFVVEPLGGTITWNEAEQKVTIVKGTTTIELWIGNNMAKINGVSVMIDPNNPLVMPLIVDPPGRTMLPLRFISEALGCTVTWDEVKQEIVVTY